MTNRTYPFLIHQRIPDGMDDTLHNGCPTLVLQYTTTVIQQLKAEQPEVLFLFPQTSRQSSTLLQYRVTTGQW